MKTMQWAEMDKTEWPRGPWDTEPDKAQWQDDGTGLPCLILRNHSGAWCGYVGVADGHPLYGKEYSARVQPPSDMNERTYDPSRTPIIPLMCESTKEDGLVSLELAIDVHGGLTFSNFCGDHSRAAWEKWRSRKADWEREAVFHPVGDSARRLREWAGTFDDYDAWVTRREATGICHVPGEGEPDRVWWLGFDCSHCDDLSPAYERLSFSDGEYRDIDYVKAEVRKLAQQIAAFRA